MPPFGLKAPKTMVTVAVLVAARAVAGIDAAAADGPRWVTGPAFQQTLAQQIDVLWSGTPLRQAMASLSRAQRVAVLIDRRVDPNQKLDLQLSGVPMGAALQQIADRCGLGVSRLGAVVYLGPPPAADHLRALASTVDKDVRRLSSSAQRKLLQSKRLAWEDLATPRDLLAQLGQQSGVTIAGLDQVPHDLWAAADLPPMSLVDRLTLIAIQFDLTFTVAVDGAEVELVPVPQNLPMPVGERQRPILPQTAAKRPTVDPGGVPRGPIKGLTIQEKPLGPVLRQLAKELDLQLKMNEKAIHAAGISLDQRVSLTVENATVDEVFRKLLERTGLTFRRFQNVVEIRPAQE